MTIEWEGERDSALHYGVNAANGLKLVTVVEHSPEAFHYFTSVPFDRSETQREGWQSSLVFAKQAAEHAVEIAFGLRPEVYVE